MKQDVIDPAVEEILAGLRDVPPPDAGRQAALRASYLAHAHRARTQAAAAQPGRARGRRVLSWGGARATGLALARIAAALILAGAMGSAGLAYAADGSVPGEALYGLDRAVEAARLAVTTRPGARVHLLLANACERLGEAERVVPGGDEGALNVAWDGYSDTLTALMASTAALAARGDGAAAARVDETLAAHEQRWTNLLGTAARSGLYGPPMAGGTADACTERGLREVAAHLARHYAIEYDDVASWMCAGGYGPGEAVLAIEIGRAAGAPAGEMLRQREAGKEWGEIYRERDDGVPGRDEPGPRDDPGTSPGQGPGGGDATPGEGERRGQEPEEEKSPGPEGTATPRGGKPEDAGKPASTGAPGATAAPGGPGQGGGPAGGTPTPLGPGQGSDPQGGTSAPGGRGP